MKSSLYTGVINHKRHLPKEHSFSYPFFMYFLNLDKIDEVQSIGRLFSAKRWALNRYFRPDYYGDSSIPLHSAIKERMTEITGKAEDLNFTHFLAEVSNIPWNERHQYAHYVNNGSYAPTERKKFKVSPFNPVDQKYTWSIQPPGEKIGVKLGVSDERGLVFEASLSLSQEPLSKKSLQRQLFKKPVMTASIVAGIYWQALRIYLKKIPYIPYEKEMI